MTGREFDTGGPAARRARRALAAGTAALVLLASGCGARSSPEERVATAAVKVDVATAAEEPWSDGLEATASLLPLRRATPGTVLMGRVDQVLHREGDRVRSGEVLARVESRDVSARLAQAEAAVTAARAMEENARLTRDRIERLHARQAASRKNLDDAVAGHAAALANLRGAEAGVEAANVAVGYSRITAPFSGVVAEKRVEVGDTAAPGMPLFVVEDTSKMKVEAPVAESALGGLAIGDPVEVEVESARIGTRRGTLAEILPAGDPRSRTFTVRVILDNPDGALRSGMFARLRIGEADRTAIAVPAGAVVRRGPLTGTFVTGGSGVARLRWITLGRSRGGRVEVLTGLQPGETFVVNPPRDLEDGARIEVK